MMTPLTRTIGMIAVLIIAAAALVVLFQRDTIARVQRGNLIITPDTFEGASTIELGRVVEITGTPDLLNTVVLEERNSTKAISYYVPLKEYGTNFVVEVSKDKLKSESQVFIGEVIGINHSEFENRIKNVLNKPVELSDADRSELDPETIELLTADTTKEFPNSALLVLDEDVEVASQVYVYVAFWTFIVTLVFLNLFRRTIFKGVFF